MALPKDVLAFDRIKWQIFQNGEWQWLTDWQLWDHLQDPPTTGDLKDLGINYVTTWVIPNASEGRPFKVKGSFAATGGTWVIKVKVGKNNDPGSCTEYTFPIDPATGVFEFEASDLHLGTNDFTWIWFSAYSHTPQNPKGIWAANACRITTG